MGSVVVENQMSVSGYLSGSLDTALAAQKLGGAVFNGFSASMLRAPLLEWIAAAGRPQCPAEVGPPAPGGSHRCAPGAAPPASIDTRLDIPIANMSCAGVAKPVSM